MSSPYREPAKPAEEQPTCSCGSNVWLRLFHGNLVCWWCAKPLARESLIEISVRDLKRIAEERLQEKKDKEP